MKTLDQNTRAAHASSVTAPLYLFKLGFNTPIYLSSREQIAWDGKTWLASGLSVIGAESEAPAITAPNTDTILGQLIATEKTAGRSLKIWRAERYEQRNMVDYSEQFDNASADGWQASNVTVTPSTTVAAPDGTFTAIEMTENTANHYHYVGWKNSSAVLSNATDYMFSWFAKLGTGTRYAKLHGLGLGGAGIVYDLATGTVHDNASYKSQGMYSVGDGWWRCWAQGAPTDVANDWYIDLADNTSGTQYTGDGSSSILIWGAQCEAGTELTEYQPVYGPRNTSTPSLPGYTEPRPVFDAQMGAARNDKGVISLHGRAGQPSFSPRQYADKPYFNHLPRRGLTFETPTQIITLE